MLRDLSKVKTIGDLRTELISVNDWASQFDPSERLSTGDRWGKIRDAILDYAQHHPEFNVDELLKSRKIKALRVSKASLIANLHGMSHRGGTLRRVESGVRGPSGIPARFALRGR
jgi:hypothetical protein